MTPTQTLLDEILDLQAKLSGKQMELAMAKCNRTEAVTHRQAMEAAIKDRRALRIYTGEQGGGCFFVQSGDEDRKSMEFCHG
jgi:deferrochelatase/peroxidase EfeB